MTREVLYNADKLPSVTRHFAGATRYACLGHAREWDGLEGEFLKRAEREAGVDARRVARLAGGLEFVPFYEDLLKGPLE